MAVLSTQDFTASPSPKAEFITQAPGGRQLAYFSRVLRGTSIYRPLLRRHRVIFIHLPKTGGQSVSQALFGDRDYIGHIRLSQFEQESQANCRKFYKFTFVRNPYARLLSAYNYIMEDSNRPDDTQMRDRILGRYRDFEAFVLHGLPNDPELRGWWHFLPQVDFLKTTAGTIGVDFIGRHETLRQDFEAVRARIGFGEPLPWLNRSRCRVPRYQDAYTDRSAGIVADLYREDLEAFGYRFG